MRRIGLISTRGYGRLRSGAVLSNHTSWNVENDVADLARMSGRARATGVSQLSRSVYVRSYSMYSLTGYGRHVTFTGGS